MSSLQLWLRRLLVDRVWAQNICCTFPKFTRRCSNRNRRHSYQLSQLVANLATNLAEAQSAHSRCQADIRGWLGYHPSEIDFVRHSRRGGWGNYARIIFWCEYFILRLLWQGSDWYDPVRAWNHISRQILQMNGANAFLVIRYVDQNWRLRFRLFFISAVEGIHYIRYRWGSQGCGVGFDLDINAERYHDVGTECIHLVRFSYSSRGRSCAYLTFCFHLYQAGNVHRIAQLFQELEYITNKGAEVHDPYNGLTDVGFEEQHAGYRAAYERLSACELANQIP